MAPAAPVRVQPFRATAALVRQEVIRLDPDIEACLEEYVRARGQRLVRTAYLLTGDRHVAEDLVQNALASLLVSWRRLRDVVDLDAYVYTALIHARSRWWNHRSRAEVPSEHLPEVATDDGTARLDRHRDLLSALGTLPRRQRQAVVLRYFDDLTEAQTAAVLGCSLGTVKSQTSRALDKLRLVLEPDREPSGPRARARAARPSGTMPPGSDWEAAR